MSSKRSRRERLSKEIAELDRQRRSKQPEVDEGTLTEAEKAFCVLSDLRGKKVYRCGWPDFFMTDPESGGVLGVKVKDHNDRVSPSQMKMFAALERYGVMRVMVWSPSSPGVLTPWRAFGQPRKDRRSGPRQPALNRSRTVDG